MDFISPEYESRNDEKQVIMDELKNIIMNSNAPLEGNYFYHHNTLNIYPEQYPKQLNLFWCGKQAVKNVCEIGFNAGHSSMLLLFGNNVENLNYTVFDIGYHPYTRPCFNYIQSKFTNVNFEYVEGDSINTMPEWINNHKELIHQYDVIHVDGGHNEQCIFNDMKNADLLLKKNGILIVDDTNADIINNMVSLYISSGNYTELNLLSTLHIGSPHRIIRKLR